MLDVAIVGAGPAGLSAALVLGRCRRRVLVCDSGQPRNGPSHALHGFLTRDGIEPLELRRIGRLQLSTYPSVEYRPLEAVDAERGDERFRLILSDGERVEARFLLLASGVVDLLPPIPGFQACFGTSVLHCPYCDGWERRDRALGVFGRGEEGAEYALELRVWSDDVALFTDGDRSLPVPLRERLARHAVRIHERPIGRLEHHQGHLERLVFDDGSSVARQALFFSPEQRQRSPLAERLGCSLEDQLVPTGKFQVASVPGLYVAGDAARSVQLAIIAAAEGAQAAFAINTALIAHDFR